MTQIITCFLTLISYLFLVFPRGDLKPFLKTLSFNQTVQFRIAIMHTLEVPDPICRWCRSKVINAVSCPGCSAPYHPSCSKKTREIPDVGFAKCCGPDASPNPSPQPQDPNPGTQANPFLFQTENNGLFQAISKQISALAAEVKHGNTRVETSIAQLKDSFAEFSIRLDRAEGNIDSVQKDITVVNNRIDNVESLLNSKINNTDFVLWECEDMQRRKLNILIFGFTESKNNDNAFHLDTDLNDIKNLIKSLFSTPVSFIDSLKITRLGKSSQSRTSPRPIRISCQDQHQVSMILSTARQKKATGTTNLQALSFAPDRTPRQQKLFKEVKTQLADRIARGETNLTIKHIRGLPTIVTSPK